jgi:prevent-host-death family protein
LTDNIAIDEFGRDPLALLEQVAAGRGGLVITRDGGRVAALVTMRDFEMIERMRARLDELCDRLGQAFADMGRAR